MKHLRPICKAFACLLLCGCVSTQAPRFAIPVADLENWVEGEVPVLDRKLGFDLPQVPGTKFSSAFPAGMFHVLANDRPGGTGSFTPATLLFTWQVSARVVDRYQVFDEHATLATARNDTDGQFKLYVLPHEFDIAPTAKAFNAIRERWQRAGNPRVPDPIRIEIHAACAGKKVAVTMIGPPPERLSVQQLAEQVAASLRWVNTKTTHNKPMQATPNGAPDR